MRQRTRIYFGCEGQSEQSYGKRLNEIADAAGLSIFLDCDLLQPGGGDPLCLVQLAARRIKEKTKKRGPFEHRFLLLDQDKIGLVQERDAQIAPLLIREKITVIWQIPCHEGFLLRHLDGQTTRQPRNTELAGSELKKVWLEYSKPMSARELSAKIDAAAFERAAGCEDTLRNFLKVIGLIKDQ